MPWEAYNTHVRIGPSIGGTIIPVTNLTVRAVPFTGDGLTIVELYDGRRVINQPTWGYEVKLSWGELGNSLDTVRIIVNDVLTNDGRDIYPVSLTSSTFDEAKVLADMALDLTGSELTAIFEGRSRMKRSSLLFKSKAQSDAVPLAWITQN